MFALVNLTVATGTNAAAVCAIEHILSELGLGNIRHAPSAHDSFLLEALISRAPSADSGCRTVSG